MDLSSPLSPLMIVITPTENRSGPHPILWEYRNKASLHKNLKIFFGRWHAIKEHGSIYDAASLCEHGLLFFILSFLKIDLILELFKVHSKMEPKVQRFPF